MAPTLQDVSYLLVLPLVGTAVGPLVVLPTWLDDLEARFTDIDRMAVVGPLEPHPRGGRQAGPSRKWLLQFQVCNVICFLTYFYRFFGFIILKFSNSELNV